MDIITGLILYGAALVGTGGLTWALLSSVLLNKTGDTAVFAIGLAMMVFSLYALEPNTRVVAFLAACAACLYTWHTSESRGTI